MPNWCDNRLAIRGEASDVMEIVKLLETDAPLDFEALLPMPKHIRAGADYRVSEGRRVFQAGTGGRASTGP